MHCAYVINFYVFGQADQHALLQDAPFIHTYTRTHTHIHTHVRAEKCEDLLSESTETAVQ
jgi:hypothetical protein